MLFPRNVLASGPQAWFGAEKGRLKVGKGKVAIVFLQTCWYS
jgi:hypothetical protein